MSADTGTADGRVRERIASVWRQRVALLGHPRPTAEEVAAATGATVAQVRQMLGGLVANGIGTVEAGE